MWTSKNRGRYDRSKLRLVWKILPQILQSIVGGDIRNEGVGGEMSTQIKNRLLAASRK
jgi:hypothetical protein